MRRSRRPLVLSSASQTTREKEKAPPERGQSHLHSHVRLKPMQHAMFAQPTEGTCQRSRVVSVTREFGYQGEAAGTLILPGNS